MIFQPIHSRAKQATKPTVLDLRSTPSIEARIIHLLAGTSDFLDTLSGTKLKTTTDYSTLGAPSSKKGKKSLTKTLIANGIDAKSIDALLLKSISQNSYYSEIFDELSRAIYLIQLDRQVQAFLHIYRALERISYSFPMIHAAVSQDYKGTFLELKKLLSEEKIEELGFFKKFTSSFIDQQYLNATTKINITHTNPTISTAHYNTLNLIFYNKAITASVPNTEITLKYAGVLSGIITLRNRYFHFMSGRTDNLTGLNIIYPDDFFRPLNPIFLNWISFIYFRILEQRTK